MMVAGVSSECPRDGGGRHRAVHSGPMTARPLSLANTCGRCNRARVHHSRGKRRSRWRYRLIPPCNMPHCRPEKTPFIAFS